MELIRPQISFAQAHFTSARESIPRADFRFLQGDELRLAARQLLLKRIAVGRRLSNALPYRQRLGGVAGTISY
jgi:hypothetical protein